MVSKYANDKRVLGWDIYNEPGNVGYTVIDNVENQNAEVFKKTKQLLEKTFRWARAANPSQPITSGIWTSDKHIVGKNYNELQLSQSDVVSFHNYGNPKALESQIAALKKLNRPILCTEYMARPNSLFNPSLGIMKKEQSGGLQLGAVSAKRRQSIRGNSTKKKPLRYALKYGSTSILTKAASPTLKKEVDYIKKVMGK